MKIFIVIVIYNWILVLCEFLELIFCQILMLYEIIIVNDVGELVVLVKVFYLELLIVVINLEKNLGYVVVRNVGVKEVFGDCIMLCDDDDFFMSGYIEKMVKEIEMVDFVYFDVEIVLFEEKNGIRYLVLWKLFVYIVDYEDMRVFFIYVLLGSMYRCFLYDEIGYFDVDVYNYWDWDFYLCVVKDYWVKCVFCVSVIYVFSDVGDNQFVDFGVKWK